MRHLQHIYGPMTRLSLILLALLFTACDAEDSPNDNGTPLYNMSYRISNIAAEVPTENLRAAFIWTYNNAEGGIAGISRDIPLDAEFPSTFKLAISDLPPVEAMSPVETYVPDQGDFECGGMPDPEMFTPEEIEQIIQEEGIVPCEEAPTTLSGAKWAVGRMVVYSDNNGNESLDKLSPAAQLENIIDQIVGPTEHLIVVYVEGDPTGTDIANELGVTTGFNLLQGIESAVYENVIDGYTTLDINADIPITLAIEDSMQSLMCEAPIEGPMDSSEATLTSFISSLEEAPADAELSCSADGLKATFSKSVTTQETLCAAYAKETEEWIMELNNTTDAPADWPCTIQ